MTSAPRTRRRPRLQDLGGHRLGVLLLAIDILVLAATCLLFRMTGLTVRWSTVAVIAGLLTALFGLWLNFWIAPGRSRESFVAEVVGLLTLMLFLSNVISPMQYGAVALGFPYVDWWLAAADRAMGVNVAALAAWTASQPALSVLLHVAYLSLLPQFLLVVVVLAVTRDRDRLWEFGFHFHFCAVVTVAALIVFPAVCPPEYYGFTPTIDMTHLIHQILNLHNGTLTEIRFDELEGLVSFPSFHAAGGLFVTWALRRPRGLLAPIAVLNTLLVASTFVTGVHYLVDVVAAVPLVAASILIYRKWLADWHNVPVRGAACETPAHAVKR